MVRFKMDHLGGCMTKNVVLLVIVFFTVPQVRAVELEKVPAQPLKCTVALETRDDRSLARTRKTFENRRPVRDEEGEDTVLLRTALSEACGPILRQCRLEGTRVYGEPAFASAGIRFACRVTYLDFRGCRVSYEGIDSVRLLQSDPVCAAGNLYRVLRDEAREQGNISRAFYARYCAGQRPVCDPY